MANLVSKNIQKTSETGIVTALATIAVYALCFYLKWDMTTLSVSLIIIFSAIFGGLYNFIKHVPINWPWRK